MNKSLSFEKLQQIAEKITGVHPYLSQEITQIYRNIEMENPPVKYIDSL